MSFNAGSIVSTLGLDVSPFSQGMLQATSIAQIFPATVTNFLANPLLGIIGLAKDAAGAIFNAFKTVGAAADNAGEAAEKAGVSVEFLTGIGAAFADAGSSVEGLSDALKFLNKNASAAANGEKTAVASFEKLGISAQFVKENLNNTEAIFFAAVDGMGRLGTTAQKTDVAMEILGRGGADAIAALNKGSGGLKSFAADIAAVGGVTDTSLAEAGDKFGTLSTFVSAAMDGIQRAVARPILNVLAEHFGDAKSGIMVIAGTLQSFVSSAIGGMVSFATAHASDFMHVFSGVGAALSGLMPLVGSLASLLGATLGPVFRLVAPLAHLFGAVIGWIADKLAILIGWIGQAVSAVASFIGLGDDLQQVTPASASPTAAAASSGANASAGGSNFNQFAAASGVAAESVGPDFGASAAAGSDSAQALGGALNKTAGVASGPFASSMSAAKTAIDAVITSGNAFIDVLDEISRRAASATAPVADLIRGAAQQAVGGAGGESANNVTIEKLNVPAFDVAAASSAIAEKILPILRTEFAAQVGQMQATARNERVTKGLGI